jgi:hypothetical protein
VLGSIFRFLVSLDCIHIIQLSKLTLAVSISLGSIVTPLLLSISSWIAFRLICPNLACASSIVFLFNTISSFLELGLGLGLLDSRFIFSRSIFLPTTISLALESIRSKSLSSSSIVELLSNSSRLLVSLSRLLVLIVFSIARGLLLILRFEDLELIALKTLTPSL